MEFPSRLIIGCLNRWSYKTKGQLRKSLSIFRWLQIDIFADKSQNLMYVKIKVGGETVLFEQTAVNIFSRPLSLFNQCTYMWFNKGQLQHVDQMSVLVEWQSKDISYLPSSGFSRMLPSQNSFGIGWSPIEVKKSSAFSNIIFWFHPWLSIAPVTLRLGLPGYGFKMSPMLVHCWAHLV